MESKLPFKIFSALTPNIYHLHPPTQIYLVFSNFSSRNLVDESGIFFKQFSKIPIGIPSEKQLNSVIQEIYLKFMSYKDGLISDFFSLWSVVTPLKKKCENLDNSNLGRNHQCEKKSEIKPPLNKLTLCLDMMFLNQSNWKMKYLAPHIQVLQKQVINSGVLIQ